MRPRLLAIVFSVALLSACQVAPANPHQAVSLDWIIGHWVTATTTGTHAETWARSAGGGYLGLLVDRDASGPEEILAMSIEADGTGYALVHVHPDGVHEVLRCGSPESRKLLFEDVPGDVRVTVEYARAEDGDLERDVQRRDSAGVNETYFSMESTDAPSQAK